MHDVVIVGIPLIAILAGILLNRSDARDLRGEMSALRNDLTALGNVMTVLRTKMHREFREFYRTLGQHDAKIENLQKAR